MAMYNICGETQFPLLLFDAGDRELGMPRSSVFGSSKKQWTKCSIHHSINSFYDASSLCLDDDSKTSVQIDTGFRLIVNTISSSLSKTKWELRVNCTENS